MACEDYPCCGHEAGDCPRVDSKGRERFRCVDCGKELPVKATSSICRRCHRRMGQRSIYDDFDYSMNS